MQEPKTQNDKRLADYWARAATPTGKASMAFRVHGKRVVWWSVINSTNGIKRVFDIVVSSCAMLALTPIYLATIIAIKKEDGGPILFKQNRVGYKGRSFKIWKFRSMVTNAEEVGRKLIEQHQCKDTVAIKLMGDPRITKTGNFIRKYSIDELPQFWNVFRGDMSIVGPRPVVPAEVADYTIEDRQRLLAKPGLTCFWQVGGRTDLDFENQVLLDVEYIRSKSIWLDIKLLFMTVPAVLLGKGAY